MKLVLQCDEVWSFVGNRRCKRWIWLAMDARTGRIVGMHVGNRGEAGARALWANLPAAYRERAEVFTDFWEAYTSVVPPERHRRVGKGEPGTQRIERFNCTLRQRCSRLVRKALSFSKRLENHIGAIWYYIHDHNASLPA